MKRAAIGVRMHSGWGALVAVSNTSGTPEIIERRRVPVAGETHGAIQPYHFAKSLELREAEKFLASCFAESRRLALAVVRDVVGELHDRQYRVVGCAILLASARPLPALPKILASHALIHTAEGEFFREAFRKASEDLGIAVSGYRERDLGNCVQTAFGGAGTRVWQQVSSLGRLLGPPWTTDQKTAAIAALLVLASKQP